MSQSNDETENSGYLSHEGVSDMHVMPLLLGILFASLIIALAKLLKFDQDRSFYPTVLIVIALYYVLFGVISGEMDVIVIEVIIATAFGAIAIGGYYRAMWIVGVGLIAHGVYDALHDQFILNTGVPDWWATFCLAVDVLLGIWIFVMVRKRHERLTQTLSRS
jgi:hypothetical protein